MPNRVSTPPSPPKPPDCPNHTSSQSPSEYGGAGQTAAHLSQSSGTSGRHHTRPKGPTRLSTGQGITTLERIWGPLFDEQGRPTVKLGQFLRGLAIYIIEDYEPRHSMVVTPGKMIKYYEDVRLSKEVYSWSTVFDREHLSISRMYSNLECQHHLVQEKHNARPRIAGLTPIGFERWMTLLIQAYPEEEFERLRKTILEMPISNPDDSNERFPKEISRRLFPDRGDNQIRNNIADSIAEHLTLGNHIPESQREISPRPSPSSKNADVIDNPLTSQDRHRRVRFADHPIISTPNPTHFPSHFERERHHPSDSDSAIDDSPPPPPSPPPYSVGGARKDDSAPPRVAERFRDGFGRIKPRFEPFVDPALKSGPTYSNSTAHPKSANTNTRRRAKGPQPGSRAGYGSVSGASCHRGSPSSYRPINRPLSPLR